MSGPNGDQLPLLNRCSCCCEIGKKSPGPVLVTAPEASLAAVKDPETPKKKKADSASNGSSKSGSKSKSKAKA